MEGTQYIWTRELPTKEGKYIVETKSMMGNTRRLEASCTINENGKVTWSFTNQTYVKHLKEI